MRLKRGDRNYVVVVVVAVIVIVAVEVVVAVVITVVVAVVITVVVVAVVVVVVAIVLIASKLLTGPVAWGVERRDCSDSVDFHDRSDSKNSS